MGKSEFLASLGGPAWAAVDLTKLTADDWQKLAAVGVSRAEVESLAGDDKIIAGAAELESLSRLIDGYERTAAQVPKSIYAVADHATLTAPTLMGVLSAAQVASNEQVPLRQFLARFGQASFDLSRMTPEVEKELAGVGVTKAALQALARNGRIEGAPAMRQLFTLLDKLDGKVDQKLDRQAAASDSGQVQSAAGRAEALLATTLRSTLTTARREYSDMMAGIPGMRSAATIDLKQFSDDDWAALQKAGVIRRKLEAVAGPDLVIKGEDETAALFDFIRSFDRDSSSSKAFVRDAYNRDSGQMEHTPAGSIYDLLMSKRASAEKTTHKGFIQRFSHGDVDLNQLTPELEQRFAALGVKRADLKALATKDGFIHGAKAADALFWLVQTSDRDGFLESYDRTRPVPLGERPTDDDLSVSGQLEALVAQLYRPFEQQEHTYQDLSAALVVDAEQPVTPVAIKVPFVCQFNMTDLTEQERKEGCFTASSRMVAKVFKRVYEQLSPLKQAHWMGRAEDAAGYIEGRAADFARGRQYIDACLDKNRPVIIGVSFRAGDYNLDAITDHFVVITGRGVDEQGRLYYTFNDPATLAVHSTDRLYVDKETGILFRPPVPGADDPYYLRVMQGAMVETYMDSGYDFAEVVGTPPTGYR
jgi:hypothetical protein